MHLSRARFLRICGAVLAASPVAWTEPAVGAFSEVAVTAPEIQEAARFAVRTREEGLRKAGTRVRIELVKIVSARQQVVAGMNYEIRLTIRVDGTEKSATVLVWEQAWNTKQPRQLMSWKEAP